MKFVQVDSSGTPYPERSNPDPENQATHTLTGMWILALHL